MPAEDTSESAEDAPGSACYPFLVPEILYFVGDITASVAKTITEHRGAGSGLSRSAQPDLCVHPEEQDPKGI